MKTLMKALKNRACQLIVAAIVACLVLLQTSTAFADTVIIKRPGARPRYTVEVEPQLLLGLIEPPGVAREQGYGFGARAALPVVKNGFIDGLNNSVAIGTGLGFVRYSESHLQCRMNAAGNCLELNPDLSVNYIILPVVMQWTFWLSRDWSVFGEPGFALRYVSRGDSSIDFDPFTIAVGGRYHFLDRLTLTLRAGWPVFSVGVSFLL